LASSSRLSRFGVLTIYGGFGVVGAVFYPFYAVAMIDRGLSAGELGLLTAATALVSSAVGPAWGHLADRVVGRRAGLAIGEISSAIGILLFAFGDLNAAIAGSLLMAIAGAASNSSADALALGIARDGGPRFAVTRAVTSFTYAITAIAAGVAIRDGGGSSIVPFLAVGLCCTILPIPFLKDRSVIAAHRSAPPRTTSSRRTRRSARDRFGSVSELLRIAPAMVPFIAIIFLEALCAASFYRLGPVRINEVGGDAAMLGLGATLAAFIEVPFMIASARMLKGIGLRRGFAAATAIMGVITASVALFDSALSLTLLRLAEGAVFAIALMCAVEVVDRLVPRRLHATGQSLYHSAGTLGAALGGIVAGVLYDTAGSTVVFIASGTGLLITALFALRTMPRGRVLLESDATHGAE
jgi:MFS transporter, PPP family, 3-phenylpropionic acid transporter